MVSYSLLFFTVVVCVIIPLLILSKYAISPFTIFKRMPKLAVDEAKNWKKHRIDINTRDFDIPERKMYIIYGEVKSSDTPEYALPKNWTVYLKFGDKIYDETSKIRLALLKLIYKDTFFPAKLSFRPPIHATLIKDDYFLEDTHNVYENYTNAIVYDHADSITKREFFKMFEGPKGQSTDSFDILNTPVYESHVDIIRFKKLIDFIDENKEKIPSDDESKKLLDLILKKIEKLGFVISKHVDYIPENEAKSIFTTLNRINEIKRFLGHSL